MSSRAVYEIAEKLTIVAAGKVNAMRSLADWAGSFGFVVAFLIEWLNLGRSPLK